MSLLCTQAELPGTSFVESTCGWTSSRYSRVISKLRNFPPLNLTFYVDADHVILEVLESWMSYINPIQTNQRKNQCILHVLIIQMIIKKQFILQNLKETLL